ncbi:bolA-like protein 3 [Glossina fuscipes]|nr:bolA-like protein 3 [Glossina fuscipes]
MISLSQLVRQFCSKASKNAEQQIRLLLMARFPQASIKVNDVSGGCGAMFDVFVEDFEFKGLTTLRQHKLVTNTLKDKIKEMHGLRIHTTIPEDTPISEPES